MNSITYNWWSFAPSIFWQAFQRKLARTGSDVSKMAGRNGKRSRNLIDYAQLNRFSSADTEYRHFFVVMLRMKCLYKYVFTSQQII